MERIKVVKVAALVACLLIANFACSRQTALPSLGSEQYQKLCSAFYLGLAALQSGEDVNARKGLLEATQIAPGEPAGWLNLGLLQFRQQDFEGAYQSVAQALTLVAGNSRVEALLGVIESRRGKQSEAISHFTRAVSLDNHNLKAAFALAGETERQNSPATDEAAQKLFDQILTVQPNNVAVLLEVVRLAAKRSDGPRVKAAVNVLAAGAEVWPEPARKQLATLQNAVNSSTAENIKGAAIQAQFLKNVLVRAPAYRQSLDEVRTPATSAGEPFLKFFKLPSPRSEPDEADRQLRFDGAAPKIAGRPTWLGTITLDTHSAPVPLWIDAAGTHVNEQLPLPFPSSDAALGPHTVVTADLNYDFKTDIVIACASGIKFFEQTETGAFHDVTAATKLPQNVLNASYLGAWAFDYDLDGDLDLVMGAAQGSPIVLRNNGDGAFVVAHPFTGTDGLSDFISADVDGDGDPDVALVNGHGELSVFANDRLGDYRKRSTPPAFATGIQAVTSADVNGDGLTDFVVLGKDGKIARLSDVNAGKSWSTATLAQAKSASTLFLADLDNNGALDLIAGDQIFLGNGKAFTPLAKSGQAGVIVDTADLDGDGRLELLTLADGTARIWHSRGVANYHWQTIRPLAARTNGDQRMNSFGVGGEIEVRADLLTQKQIIHGPIMHFGMGSHHGGSEFARIGWPNGLIQTEFNLKPDQTLVAEQRLKGSCPYLFAWDGTAMRFVKDVAPMTGALGAHGTQGKIESVGPAEEWFLLHGDQLQPKDGLLRLSVTDEYWESYFIDRYALTAIDHPRGSVVFVDERAANPPVPQKIYITEPVKNFAAIHEDTFVPDTYAGVGHDHVVELTLPEDAPQNGELYLIAQGSIRPWDDMTLVALGQSSHAKPKGLSMEVRDARGHWKVVSPDLGVPAGRLKTIVLSLRNIFPPGSARTLRLRTNLAIFWDRLVWARALPENQLQLSRLPLADAALQHRGFSGVHRDASTGIEQPDYNNIVETGERWPSLEGYYTRYGDVSPLLRNSDSRFTIVSSGDELRMSFREGFAPATGTVRDYVFAGDGWIKEGDYSFRASQALLPLPYQGLRDYPASSPGLENERAFRMHPDDWDVFHTRYLTGKTLRSALWR